MAAAAAYRSGGRTLMSSWNRLFVSKTLTPKSIPTLSPKPPPFSPLRLSSVLASVDSMMPLHSAIASARLTSKIALHSACWSCLSQGFATPL